MTIQCKKCGAEFETGPEVGAHARAEHSKLAVGEDRVPYYCHRCALLTDDLRGYVQHRGGCTDPEGYKEAAYHKNVERMLLRGYTPRVDDKDVTGYHLP